MNARYTDLTPMIELGTSPMVIEEMHFGEWYEINTPQKNLARLQIPVLADDTMQVKIVYECKLEISDFKKRDETNISHPTFPDANPIFNLHTQRATPPEDVFEIVPATGTHIKSLAEARKQIPAELKQAYFGEVKPAELAALRRIGRTYRIEKKENIFSFLQGVYDAVRSLVQKGEVKGLQEYDSLESLLQEFNDTRMMTGDCKSISTITTGFLTAFGIPSRRIGGEIISKQPEQHKFPYHRNGHSWSEVYLPFQEGSGGWFPIDIALNTFLEYRSDLEYIIWVDMPLFEGKEKNARMRIDIL